MTIRGMSWGMSMTGVSPIAKLCAIYIGDLCDPDLGESSVVTLSEIAQFACTTDDDVLAAVDELCRTYGLQRADIGAGKLEFRLPMRRTQVTEPRPDSSPLWVYVIACESRTKVGISGNVSARFAALQSQIPESMTLVWQQVGPAHLIRQVERASHAELAPKRLFSEWFDVLPQAAIMVVKTQLQAHGINPE